MRKCNLAFGSKSANTEVSFHQARQGVQSLRASVDTLVVVPNDRLMDLITEKVGCPFHSRGYLTGRVIQSKPVIVIHWSVSTLPGLSDG
jgi:hypothetical protein